MRLVGARVALDANRAERRELVVTNGRFGRGDDGHGMGANAIDLAGYLLLPGLINAHDHLDLNLFPRLGARIYRNATEWAADVYHPDESPVREHLTVPKRTRLIWGGIRNLLSGVTTVAHHNPPDPALFSGKFPVRVPPEIGWAHSLEFSRDIADRFRECPPGRPFIVHAAEGTDRPARAEIHRLDVLGVLSDRTVLVHAIGVGSADIRTLRERSCSIVWCPRSNLMTYGRTLAKDVLRSGIPIAMGTDSALTNDGDLSDELLVAHRECGMAPEELYGMVTTQAAKVLRLSDGEGLIQDGGVADLVAIADRGQTPAEALLDLRPQMTMLGGRIKLLSKDFPGLSAPDLAPIHHETRGCLLIDADVEELSAQTAAAIGSEYRLAGRRVTP